MSGVGRHIVFEVLHLAAGLVLSALFVGAAGWAYPLGRGAIHGVGAAMALAIVAMAIGPLRRAIATDHAHG